MTAFDRAITFVDLRRLAMRAMIVSGAKRFAHERVEVACASVAQIIDGNSGAHLGEVLRKLTGKSCDIRDMEPEDLERARQRLSDEIREQEAAHPEWAERVAYFPIGWQEAMSDGR